MTKVFKLIVLISFFLLFFSSLHAQQGKKPEREGKGNIEGNVKVKETEEPLEYANIVLYKQADSSIVTGTVSSADGQFNLSDVPFGKYYMEVDFIGFYSNTIPGLNITPRLQNEEVGTVYLEEASQEIEGVQVSADRMKVEYKVDKKVINVEKDFGSEGGSAVDVLENVPSVQVDIEGNVELRGTGNFRVLINGKPSVLEGSEALQQLPANRISNIEIITNPSAKYDPEGTGGIINIIMKEQKERGLNGQLKASAGMGDKYDASVNLNYRTGKLNFFTSLDYRDFNFDMTRKFEQENYYSEDSISYLDQNMDRTMNRTGYSAKGGIDYYVTDNSTLTFSAQTGTYGFGMDAFSKTARSRPDFFRHEISNSGFDSDHNYYRLSMDFQNNFDDNGHQLNSSAFYSGSDNTDDNYWDNYLTDSDWETLSEIGMRQQINQESEEDELQLKVDYTRPIDESELEIGYMGTYDISNENYVRKIYENEEWVTDESSYNSYDFYRFVQAMYTTYSGNALGIDYKLGIRGEYTKRELEKASNEQYFIDRFDVFPSAHFSKEIDRGEQVFLSYSRRIRRPRSWFLDPFERQANEYTMRVGNPGLEPEYTGSYEIGYKKSFNSSFVSVEGYHRRTSNKIERIQKLGENDKAIMTSENVDEATSTGVEATINSRIYKWWNLNASGSLYRYELEGDVSTQNVSTNSNNWNLRFNNDFRLPSGTRFQLTAMYVGPSVTSQGEREGFFMTNAAIKQSLLDNNLTLTLSGRDLFQSRNREMTSSGPDFQSSNYFERESPIVTFSVSYSFNNYKEKRRERDQSGQEFEDMETF
ncbi:MAG: TonB-dependent receptor family protein [Bacteroidales bacterium]